jgi:hypothetical protein
MHVRKGNRAILIAAGTALIAIGGMSANGANAESKPASPKPSTSSAQQFCLPETDPNSPRKSRLKSSKPDPKEIVRIDVDQDGDPDILETWWNGKRVRWIDENDNMKPTDVRGDTSGDSLQIDRDGDGYYDGPDDLNIKWADDDGDGRADVELFAANPTATQKDTRGGSSVWMIYIDLDHDGVLGYVDWRTFEFNNANWRVPPTTSPWHLIPPPDFSPDYNGNSMFLKEHRPPGSITNPELNWENPFAFFDFDNDGCTEMTIRLLNTATRTAGTAKDPRYTFDGFANEAMGGWDIDNDSTKGNEQDFDMSFRFFSAADGSKGDRIDYRKYKEPHPNMKAPQWVLDGHYFRWDNWRRIDHFVHVPHDRCFDEMWHTNWGSCWFVFDEDDDDHRWERVEFQYPTRNPYSVHRWGSTKNNRGEQALGGHPQADMLGDRGEWDQDNSGKGKLYIGSWDGKLHLYGAESGAWTVDEHAKYWGSRPALGNSSLDDPKNVGELVQYKDTDNNGFFDRITYDYDGDGKVDLTINLLDFKTKDNPHPDVRQFYDPAKLKWAGVHELFTKLAKLDFQEGQEVYRAAWVKGLTNHDIDDDAIAASTWEQYDHGYFLKEKLFRLIDQRLTEQGQTKARDRLRRAYFTHQLGEMCDVIAGIDANKLPPGPATAPTVQPPGIWQWRR